MTTENETLLIEKPWKYACEKCGKWNDNHEVSSYCPECAKAYQERIKALGHEYRPIGE